MLRSEIIDVKDFESFQGFWHRFENFLADRMVLGHLNVLESHGWIPGDFEDINGQLAYQVGEETYRVDYTQLAREWTVTIR